MIGAVARLGASASGRAALLMLLAGSAEAAPASLSGLADAPPGATACSGCHGAAGSLVPAIRGRPAAEIAAAMDAFRSGARPATVMNRIAAGFTPEESQDLAAWLSRQAAP